jgi:sulfate permease, SulP family
MRPSAHHPLLLPSLRGYRREWLDGDLLAALTLLVIAIPEQLATARLAGMPPITGYYAFLAGAIVFAFLGSNPLLSVGADSTIAPLFAVGIGHIASSGSTRYIELVAIAAVFAGAIVAIVWLLRLGWIAELLSNPIITGFLAGVAVIIVVHQLPDLLGLHAVGGSTLHRVGYVLSHLGHVHGWTVSIGIGVLAVVIASERIDRRVPGAMLALVASTILVAAIGAQRHGIAVLGHFGHGSPHVGLGGLSMSALGRVAPVAGVIALVVVTQTAATTRAFAGGRRGQPDAGRDFLGVGVGSVAAGLIGAFPVNASPPRTAAAESAGGHTQLSGLVAAVAVMALIPAAGLLKDLPLATLAGVLVAVASRIFRVRDLVAIARFDPFEWGLAVVTLLAVALIGVEQGIGVAVALAILDRTRLSARTHLHVLGRIPGTTSWAPLSSRQHPVPEPAVLVVLFASALWYANASHFSTQFEAALAESNPAPRAVVLDAIGMSDIDFTGTRALRDLMDQLDGRGLNFAVARAGDHLRGNLQRAGLAARIGDERFFGSVDQAVRSLSGG